MKFTGNALLLGSLVLFISSCAVSRLQITEAQEPLRSFEDIPKQDISIVRVKQELREGDFDVAEYLLNAISKAGDEDVEIHIIRGRLYHYQNRLQAALCEFEKALTLLNPTAEESIQRGLYLYEDMGYLYYDLNDYKKAAVYLRKCKELGGKIETADMEFFERFQGLPYQIETQKQTVSLKMNYKIVPVVKASVNEVKEIDFIVDTGAQMTVLSSEMAKKLNVKTLARGSKGAGSGGEFPVELGVIDSLKLGNVVIRNVPVVIIDSKKLTFKLLGLFTIFKVDGAIGLPLLKQFDVTFDYKDKRLILDIPQKEEEPLSFEGNFYLVRDILILPVGINGMEGFTFVLDTGGGGVSASITPWGLEELQGQQLKTSKRLGGDWGAGGGGIEKIKEVKNLSLRICGLDIQKVNMYVDKTLPEEMDKLIEIDGFIENLILENFKVKIDFRKMQMRLVR